MDVFVLKTRRIRKNADLNHNLVRIVGKVMKERKKELTKCMKLSFCGGEDDVNIPSGGKIIDISF